MQSLAYHLTTSAVREATKMNLFNNIGIIDIVL